MPSCRHLDQLFDTATKPAADVCEICVKEGRTWVHLRRCQTCGFVGCCDASEGKHARAHFQETHHPVIRSNEGREQWAWCFVDKLEYDPDEDWDREGADLG